MENINENELANQPELLGNIDKILKKVSIAARVSDIQPMNAPVAAITGSKWDKTEKKFLVIQADIEAQTEKVETEFSIEALQDLKSVYKEGFIDLLTHYIIDDLTYKIDEKFITMITDRAVDKGTLTLTSDEHDTSLESAGRSVVIKINKGLADLPISDNRSGNGWAIVSSNVASLLSITVDFEAGLKDESPSYLGRISGVDYFIDYTNQNNATNDIIYGIKGNGYSRGSTIFSPYTAKILSAINPSSLENKLIYMDRTGMTINPMDKEYFDAGESGFIGKLSVDFTDMKAFN